MKNTRFIMNISERLSIALEMAAKHERCSRAEIVRSSLYQHLKNFIVEEKKETEQNSFLELIEKMLKGNSNGQKAV